MTDPNALAEARKSRLVMADAGEAIKIAEDAASQALDRHIGEPAWQVSPRAVSIIRAALLSSLESSGWVIVPTEATEDMLETGKIAAVTTHRVDQVYESMVAAAPRLTGEKRSDAGELR